MARDDGDTRPAARSWARPQLYKILVKDKRGTPLCSNNREWCEGSYPQALLDARAYVNEQVAKLEQIALAA